MNKLTTKIQKLLLYYPKNSVLTVKGMQKQGITYNDINRLQSDGWLKKISGGAYSRFDGNPTIEGAVFTLQKDLGFSTHIGGRSALFKYYGDVQYSSVHKIMLFSQPHEELPNWFNKLFCGEYSNHMTNFIPVEMGMVYKKNDVLEMKVSSEERSLFELMYEVPAEITQEEAYEIMEFVTSVKVDLIQDMLEACNSVKVKRLLLCFASIAEHQWVEKIDKSKINLGAGVRTIEKNGEYNKEYELVVSRELKRL